MMPQGDGSLKVDFDPSNGPRRDGNRITFSMPLDRLMVSQMTRFLGKMALGELDRQNPGAGQGAAYDELRRYVRYGDTKRIWPLFIAYRGSAMDLHTVSCDGTHLVCSTKLYSQGFFPGPFGDIYMFSIGRDYYLISLTHRGLDLGIRLLDPTTDPLCVHFSEPA
jgi:hypothetical protein